MWKGYALAQDFMSAEAFAAREHLNRYQKVKLSEHLSGQRTEKEEEAIAELAAAEARKDAIEHVQQTRAGLQAFLDEAADFIEVWPSLDCREFGLGRGSDLWLTWCVATIPSCKDRSHHRRGTSAHLRHWCWCAEAVVLPGWPHPITVHTALAFACGIAHLSSHTRVLPDRR